MFDFSCSPDTPPVGARARPNLNQHRTWLLGYGPGYASASRVSIFGALSIDGHDPRIHRTELAQTRELRIIASSVLQLTSLGNRILHGAAGGWRRWDTGDLEVAAELYMCTCPPPRFARRA